MSALPRALYPLPTASTSTTTRPGQMSAEQAEQAALRARLREFLRAIPESEPDTVLELRFPDGSPDGSIRQVSRGQLTARIRWLRPRLRRILERQIIGHVSREQVAKELCVCVKTLERDHVEALEILLGEARAI